jgi:hypothetical protein
MNRLQVVIAGHGVGQRLHEPVWREAGAKIAFVRRLESGLYQPWSFSDNSCDLLIVATPPFRQLTDALVLMNAYRKSLVLIEKPGGRSFEELAGFGRSLGPGACRVRFNYELRYHVVSRLLMISLQQASISWTTMTVVYRSASSRASLAPAWYSRCDLGGGICNAVTSHLIDLLLYLRVVNPNGHPLLLSWSPAQMHLQLVSLEAPASRSVNLDVKCDQSNGAFAVVLQLSNQEYITFDFLTCTVKTASHFDIAIGGALHDPAFLRSSHPGAWRDAYHRFAQTFSQSVKFGEEAATLADALKAQLLLDKVRLLATLE